MALGVAIPASQVLTGTEKNQGEVLPPVGEGELTLSGTGSSQRWPKEPGKAEFTSMLHSPPPSRKVSAALLRRGEPPSCGPPARTVQSTLGGQNVQCLFLVGAAKGLP